MLLSLQGLEPPDAAPQWTMDVDGTVVVQVAPSSVSSGRNIGMGGSCAKMVSREEFSSPLPVLVDAQVSRSRASMASYSSPDRCFSWWVEVSTA